jgi:hypothetical protein
VAPHSTTYRRAGGQRIRATDRGQIAQWRRTPRGAARRSPRRLTLIHGILACMFEIAVLALSIPSIASVI